jgi:two-component system, cell cycle sensor histidine kinase and response regulator CckA
VLFSTVSDREAAGDYIWPTLRGFVVKPPSVEPPTRDAREPSALTSRPLRVRKSMQYRALLDAAPDAIVVVNQSGVIVLVNAQAERLFGYRRDEMIGQAADILVSEHSRDQHSEHHSRFLAAAPERPTVVGLELFGLRKDGTEFPAEIRLSPLDTKGGVLVSSAIRDISDRRRTEEDLRRLAAIVAFSDDAIVGKTMEGIITSWNAGAERIFGYSPKEAIGQPVTMLVPADRPDEVPRMLECLKRGETVEHFETVRVRKGGTAVQIEVTVSPIRDALERIIGASTIGRDISVRKAAEKHLVQMEARYRGLLEAAPDAMVVVNQSGEIVLLNLQAEKQFGYRRDELLGQKVKNIIPEGFAERLIADALRSAEDALAQQIGTGIELIARRKNGSDFPIELMLSPLESSEGTLVTAAIRDISVRKAAEKHLAQMEGRYRGLLEAAPDAMVVVDQGGEIVILNVQAERQFGYRRDELIGQKVKNIIPQGFAERLIADGTRSAAEALAQQIGTGIELNGRRKNGSEFPIEIMLSPLDGADGILVTAAIRDITERKRRAYDMSCLAAVVESSHDAIVGLTPEGIVLSWNHGAERIYGYTAAETVGRSILFTSPPERAAETLDLLKGVQRGESVEPFETVRVKKDGTRIHVSLTLSPIENSDGQVVGVSAVARDVTESKNLEAMLRQAQKMEAVGQLAGGVAHDFNNLLGVILGYTGLMLDRMSPNDSNRKGIEEIQKAGDRAALLTRQLLAFSRKQVLQPKVLDLNSVVAGTEKLLQRLIGEHIELRVVLKPALGRVKADAGQLEQIIMNLAVNARDAMPPGGKLTIETSNVEIDEDYALQHPSTQAGPHVMLSVSDTGCGMDADTKAHMFEPFFTTKEFGKGTGLGLSTVYGIVKQSGGSVWVYSEVGIGTTFKIYLPCVGPAPEIAAPSDIPEKIEGGLQTILVVEDEVPLLEVTHRSLEAFGYVILAANSPAEAMRISASHPGPIHLMVTDVIMPGMSGAQLASRLSASRPEMKVLYVSGYTDDTIVRHGVLEPGLAFLQKPFSPRTLARKVDEVLTTVLV